MKRDVVEVVYSFLVELKDLNKWGCYANGSPLSVIGARVNIAYNKAVFLANHLCREGFIEKNGNNRYFITDKGREFMVSLSFLVNLVLTIKKGWNIF